MTPPAPRPDTLARFMGGRPLSVALRLAAVSVIVGAFLHLAGLSPLALLQGVEAALVALIGSGWDALATLARFCFYGAMIVVPLWLAGRLLASRRS